MEVQVIKASKTNTQQPSGSAESEKLKVAAYCRVSTDAEEQESSYEAQCTHYTNYIQENPHWVFAGIYADEGISGTSTKRREQFNKMIADCEAGKIGMVVTKSISRFARNTLDCLKYIRRLKELGIAIFFEKENINTLDAKGEVLITIMASIAQQESQSISQNVRLGIQYQMQEGKGRLNTAFFMGLTKESGTLVIVPEEAVIVRRIFREYLEGYSPGMICKHLESDGILTKTGGKTWYQSTIASMLENEKYCGDLLMQKYYTADFLSHKIVKNTGQLPQYYVEDDHEPIIPKPVFFQVQGELMRRSVLRNDPSKLRYGSGLALSGRLVCGKCGRTLKRYVKPDKRLTDWRCRNRAYTKKTDYKEVRSACGCRFAGESEVKEAIVRALNRLPDYRKELLQQQDRIRTGELKRIDALKDSIKKQRKCLEERRQTLEKENSGNSVSERIFLSEQIAKLEKERNELALERAEYANQEIHIRLLLELVESMKEMKTGNAGLICNGCDTGEGTSAASEPMTEISPGNQQTLSVACYDYDEFFRITRYKIPDGIMNQKGEIVKFDNSMVIRYLDTVTVLDDGYVINFKAGFRMKMELPCS